MYSALVREPYSQTSIELIVMKKQKQVGGQAIEENHCSNT